MVRLVVERQNLRAVRNRFSAVRAPLGKQFIVASHTVRLKVVRTQQFFVLERLLTVRTPKAGRMIIPRLVRDELRQNRLSARVAGLAVRRTRIAPRLIVVQRQRLRRIQPTVALPTDETFRMVRATIELDTIVHVHFDRLLALRA